MEYKYGNVVHMPLQVSPQELRAGPKFREFSIGDCWSCNPVFASWCICQPRVLSEEDWAQVISNPPEVSKPFMDGEFAGISIHKPLTVWVWKYTAWQRALHSYRGETFTGESAMLCDLMLSKHVLDWRRYPPKTELETIVSMPILLVGENVMCFRRGFESFQEFQKYLQIIDVKVSLA